jgi:uncharacterized coiled-coil DUF342 family protein
MQDEHKKLSYHRFMASKAGQQAQGIKVELGKIDDVKKDRDSAASKVVSLKSKINADAMDMRKAVNDLVSSRDEMKRLYAISKELGADDATKNLDSLIGSTSELISSWGKATDNIISAIKLI